jgi:hypothetical protein
MTVSRGDAQALTWIARRLREDTHGCGPWDAAGTYAIIAELVGQNLAETVHRVIGHALDPEARTPGSIRRPFIPKRDEPTGGRVKPAKAGEDCKRHPGEYVGSCRACLVDVISTEHDVVLADDDRTAGRALREQIRARRLGVAPEPSPAPVVATEPAVDDAAAGLVTPPQDVQQRAGESDDRPETACAADGCFRPTRDGICDRCRATAAAEALQAANVELVDRLHANERERARNRPEPDPDAPPPRYFTSADYDPEKVHAAQAQAAEQRRSNA